MANGKVVVLSDLHFGASFDKTNNTGSFVKKRNKESNDCTNSFIIIDPSLQEDEKIKVYHMSDQEMEPCVFDKDGACNRMCKK